MTLAFLGENWFDVLLLCLILLAAVALVAIVRVLIRVGEVLDLIEDDLRKLRRKVADGETP